MARYTDVPDAMKITSEHLEPAFACCIGRWWAQAEYMKATYGARSIEYADAIENLWHGLRCLSNLASLAIDSPHAAMMVSNHITQVARYIEGKFGFSPFDIKDAPFRAYL